MGSAGVFDKIEKEALKLYERSVKIRTMTSGGASQELSKGLARVRTRWIAAKELFKGIFS
ncbi:hypothetical protein BUQ74_16050 [Leptospira weilii serovar Heyan]|nr:hypothetical protein BUQ74_16050 [Leptospira weilii serovar Heyan]